jgi:hypothetical protein
MNQMKYLKSLITVILLLISTICFADSAQKLDKVTLLAVKYDDELSGLNGKAQGIKAYEILKEIRSAHLLNAFNNLYDYKEAGHRYRYVLGEAVFDYMSKYPNSNIEQLEYLLNCKIDKTDKAYKIDDDNFFNFSMFGMPYLLYRTKNGIKSFELGNRVQPQVLVGIIKKPIFTLVIADYDCNGSGCDPKIRLVSLIDDDFKEVYKSTMYFHGMGMLKHEDSGENEIIGSDPIMTSDTDNMNTVPKFPTIYHWDGKDLIDTTFSHKEYIVNWYNETISVAESDEESQEMKRDLKRIDSVDDFIKEYSDEGAKFWEDNLKDIRKNYYNWIKSKEKSKS